MLRWTARPSAQRTEAAGRVIVSGNGSLVVSSGRERARAESGQFGPGEWALDSGQSTRRSWSCSWGNPSAGISGICEADSLSPTGSCSFQGETAETGSRMSRMCVVPLAKGLTVQPGNHPRTHAPTHPRTHPVRAWLLPPSSATLDPLLSKTVYPFCQVISLKSSQQAIRLLSKKRGTLRGACIDHEQQPAPPTSMRSIVHWLHPAKLLSQV